MRCISSKRRGFTLVELLVVIAVIGILIGLLLPAVIAAREAGRRNTCRGHVSELGKAMVQHQTNHGFYPAGGWGEKWIGDATRGFGREQPGGWIFNILPYIEETALHAAAKEFDASTSGAASQEKFQILADMGRTPLRVLHCPSRRRVQRYPVRISLPNDYYAQYPFTMINTDFNLESMDPNQNPNRLLVAKTDYAANGGNFCPSGCEDYESCMSPNATQHPTHFQRRVTNRFPEDPTYEQIDNFQFQNPSGNDWPNAEWCNGLVCPAAVVSQASIRDGVQYTYLVGEKYLDAANYQNGQDLGDDGSAYAGYDLDTVRYAGWTPERPHSHDRHLDEINDTWQTATVRNRMGAAEVDTVDDPREAAPSRSSLPYPKEDLELKRFRFGAAHSAGWHAMFCDGSTRMMSYAVDFQVHADLGNRADLHVMDDASF